MEMSVSGRKASPLKKAILRNPMVAMAAGMPAFALSVPGGRRRRRDGIPIARPRRISKLPREETWFVILSTPFPRRQTGQRQQKDDERRMLQASWKESAVSGQEHQTCGKR